VRAALCCFLAVPAMALAQAQSPGIAGVWQTSNDAGQPDGLVRIVEMAGGYDISVLAVFSPPAPSSAPLCERCEGELRDKPVVGMVIARGLRRDGDGWTGTILDPDEGKTYRCVLQLADGGRTLKVRGYVGLPLFGRTQTWTRRE
jgi:uncharacterized protein (DUF2147 family)